MKATEAATLSKKFETLRQNEAWERRQAEDTARAARVKKLLPELVRSAMEQIEEAVQKGEAHVSITAGEDTYGALAGALEKEGYQTTMHSENNNYGDSAAPCMQMDYWVRVSWRQERSR